MTHTTRDNRAGRTHLTLRPQHWVRFIATLLACVASFSAHALDNRSYSNYKVIKHPGKLSLVYYYADNNHDLNNPSLVVVAGRRFQIDFGVRPPTVNSVFLLERSEVQPGDDVLDMGTGSGFHAIFAASTARRVVATDIDSLAIDNAKRNAREHQVADKIDFRVGDLFGAVRADEQFDVIYLNLAYPFDDKSRERWKLHERFFADVGAFMKPQGRIYYQIGLLDNIPYVQTMLARNQLQIMRLEMVNAVEVAREPVMMMIQKAPNANAPALNPTAGGTPLPATSAAPAPLPAR